jgi:hypothetical protein
MKHRVPLVPTETMGVLDRGSDSTGFWCQGSSLSYTGTLIRVKRTRCVSRHARGPRKEGDTRRLDTETTPANPDGPWEGTDAHERRGRLSGWNHLHDADARSLDLTVIRVARPHGTTTERDPRVRWVVWIGDPEADLVSMGLGDVVRVSHEQGSRFQKPSLLWDQPRLRTPEQVERGTQRVARAHHQLVVATEMIEPTVRPWEHRHRPATPQPVPRAMGACLPLLGTPTRHPHPRGTSPGRAKAHELCNEQRTRSKSST